MNYYFLFFEIAMLVLVAVCMVDAWKRGWLFVAKVVAGICFGLLLEWATIQQLQAYSYGRFMMMLADEVPVAIGLGWGVIIYSAALFTDSLKLPPAMRPIMDALLALNIDLAMDSVAIRLGMWNWGIPLNTQFFGVKWGNYWAWFWVVFFFSAAYRLFAVQRSQVLKLLTPLLAIGIGTVGVLLTNYIITALVPTIAVPFVVFGVIIVAVIIVMLQKPQVPLGRQPLAVLLVPLVFHVFFLLTGLISGALIGQPILLAISSSMYAVALFLHRHGYRQLLKLAA